MASSPKIDEISERARLAALASYRIVDTPAEEIFDDIARRAAQLFGAPVAMIGFMEADRYWVKAVTGLPADKQTSQVPRSLSFCQYSFLNSSTLVVPDAQADERFADLPMVNRPDGFRFYAGTPLRSPEGHVLGTLSVLDRIPRHPTDAQLAGLRELAAETMELLRWRRGSSNAPFALAGASNPPFATAEATPAPGRLLVVDDDEHVRAFVCDYTRRLGYEVYSAAHGAEALALLERHPDPIRLVLTDINMPVMDGLELVRALRKQEYPPAIAVMSGRLDPAMRRSLQAEGVTTLLAKPFALDLLKRALQVATAPAR